MNFTGSQLTIKRNFYTQTGNFGFSVSCSVDNTTGQYLLGLSGSQGVLEFRLESGKLYYENQFIHSYVSDEPFVIEGQFTTGSANVIKDGAPLIYGQPKNTGHFDYFYMTRANASLGASFDLNVSGNNFPTYSITQKGYLIQSGQEAVTGYFVNESAFPIRVFDSSFSATANYSFGKLAGTVGASSQGTFAYTGNFDTINFSSPILTTFNTNFADTSILFSIIDARMLNRFVLLTEPTDFSFNDDAVLDRTVSWSNYSGGFIVENFDTNLFIALEYVNGSGTFTDSSFATGANFVGTAIGNFAQSGLLTGAGSFATGNSRVTGVYYYAFQQFAWATGAATGFFSGLATGLGTGIGYTGRAISSFTGLATGIIRNGSGTLSLGFVTGFPIGPAYSLDYPSYSYATGYINISGMEMGDAFYVGDPNTPLVKGVQFTNETGLVYYLSGAPVHQVNGVYNGGEILLTALQVGELGNSIQVWESQCALGGGLYAYTPYLTGGAAVGTTGDLVIALGTFTGSSSDLITGSGSYQQLMSGSATGLFLYARTFTGAWDVQTGLSSFSLVSMKRPDSSSANTFSGYLVLPPNDQMILRVVSSGGGINTDVAQLIISGSEVLNPITQTLISPNG